MAEKESTATDLPLDQASSNKSVVDKREHDADRAIAAEAPEAPPRDIHGWKWVVSYIALLSSIFLYAFDCTVVADIQTSIINEFGAIDQLSWLSNGLVMPATAMVLPWGRLYGQFNPKTLFLVCVFIFEVGSALCGAAPTINALIVGRALAGAGGSGIYMGVMTLMAATTTMKERPFYIGLTGITWGFGIVLGPIIGGAFAISTAGWRWAFYVNLLVAVPAVPSYILLLPNHVDPRLGISSKARWIEMDYAGNLLLIGGIITFILAINWGGIVYPWKSGPVIGCFVASGVLFIILGIQQVSLIGTTLSRRVLPVQIFNNPTILLLFACCAAGGASAFVPIYFVPTFFQITRSDSPLEAGVRLLPFIVVMVVIITLNGYLMGKFGYYQPWIMLGGLLAMTGAALMYTVRVDTSEARIYGYTIILGAGVGMWLQVPFSAAQALVAPEDIPAAVGLVMLGQYVGITISLAIANSVFLNDAEMAIGAILPDVSSETIKEAMEGATSGFLNTLDEAVKAQVLEAIVAAMDKAYILIIVAGSLTAVFSLFLPRKKLFGAGGITVA